MAQKFLILSVLALSLPLGLSLTTQQHPGVEPQPPAPAQVVHDAFQMEPAGYAAWRFRLDGPGAFAFTVDGTTLNGTNYAYDIMWWRDDQSPGPPNRDLGVTTRGAQRVHARVGSQVNVRVHESLTCGYLNPLVGSFCGFAQEGGLPLEPGNWTMVYAYAVSGDWNGTMTFDVSGPGATFINRTFGPARLALDDDFEGPLNVGLVDTLGLTAKIMGHTHVDYDVAHRLFGFFWGTTATQQLRMGYDQLASGEHFDGSHFYEFDGMAPGGYRFRVDENEDVATPPSVANIFLFVADVALPT